MDSGISNRLRLWLRGERAFGLVSVPGGSWQAGLDDVSASTDVVAPARPAESAAVRPTEVARELTRQLDAAVRSSPPGSPIASPAEPAAAPAVDTASGASSLFGGGGDVGALVGPDAAPFDSPPLPPDEKRRLLTLLDEQEVRGCPKCRLCETRTQTVFGEGDPDARVFFIGEGPGENEDRTGRPFVGKAGELLNKQIAAMGLKREQVYIGNIVKCRPPQNREPAPDETAACTPYLVRQIEVVRPTVIVTLGRPATQYMLQSKQAMSRLRGQWHAWRGIKLMPTYHPAFLLRQYTDQNRAAVWDDLKKVMAELGLPVRQGGTR